jgi:3-oxoacyl-[acyl-carrier-protein] synthase-3
MKATIKQIAVYLPEKIYTNEDIEVRFPEWSIKKVSEKTGINIRHHSADNEFASDMGVKSALKLFEEYSIDPQSIDFLLFCTQSPDYFLPTSSCIIQDKLGLKTSCGAFDFNLGCSGFIYGLSVAKGLIETGQAKNVLLITSETYTKHIHSEDKGNLSIFGDASTSTFISQTENESLYGFVFGTDGRGFEKLIVKNGGMKNQKNSDKSDQNNYLFMNGAEIFSFTLTRVPELVNKTLEKSKLNMEDIDLFIFHQANKYMLDSLRKKIGIPENKFYSYLSDVGNTVSSTIPIALENAIKEKKLLPGMKTMLVGFGVGYSWGACIFEY